MTSISESAGTLIKRDFLRAFNLHGPIGESCEVQSSSVISDDWAGMEAPGMESKRLKAHIRSAALALKLGQGHRMGGAEV